MNRDASDARNSAASATSSAEPFRASGVSLRYCSIRSGVLNFSWCGVSMTPGIMGIPTVILVGKDGKVVNLEARGEKLGELLEQLLGDDK